jgi:hypothetical protein
MKSFYTLFFVLALSIAGHAQCDLGDVPVYVHLYTDAWGEENYWELVPSGSDCGMETIGSGGNGNVGCDGLDPANAEEGNPDNSFLIEGPFCLTMGLTYDLIFVDSYGDGGLTFEIYEEAALTQVYNGQGDGNTWTFTIGESILPLNDSPCNAISMEVNAAPILCNNSNAIAASSEPSPAGGPCGLPGAWCDSDDNATNSIWYSFVASANVSYEITTCNDEESFDTQLALYRVAECNDFSTYELISSNDDMIGGCQLTNGFASRMFVSCLEEGTTYFIQLDGWQGGEGNTSLAISTTEQAVSLEAYVHDVNCPLDKGEEADGAIEVYLIGSGSDFTASWSGVNDFTSSENWVETLDPGVYAVTVTDACGNTYADVYEIELPAAWNVAISQTEPSCDVSGDGAMLMSINGATSPYECIWIGPDNLALEGFDLANLNPGSYTYTVEDDNGCQFLGAINLASSESFSFDLGEDESLCLDAVEVLAGPLNCDYLWQDGSVNQFFTIDASSYGVGSSYSVILTATNDLGCVHSEAFIFSVETCGNIATNEAEGIRFFPNPARQQINWTWNDRMTDGHWRILDGTGKQVDAGVFYETNSIQAPINLANGYYFFEVQTMSNTWRLPFAVEQ